MTDPPQAKTKYRISTQGLFAYATLWAVTFGVIHFLSKHSSIGAKGTYTAFQGHVTDVGLPIAIGLVLACVGLTIAFFFGKSKHYQGIFVACFMAGLLLIPVMIILMLTLGIVGVIDLD